jgi:hypothetical protein
MNAKHQIQRRTTRLSQKPVCHPEQREDPELTSSQKLAFFEMLNERLFLPVLKGEVPIREVLTPAGGWERLELAQPIYQTI